MSDDFKRCEVILSVFKWVQIMPMIPMISMNSSVFKSCQIISSDSWMISNDVKLFQTISSDFKWTWFRMISNDFKRVQVISNNSKRCKMLLNDFKLFQMISNDFKWFQMISTTFKRFRMISNDFKWVQLNSSEFKWAPPRPPNPPIQR